MARHMATLMDKLVGGVITETFVTDGAFVDDEEYWGFQIKAEDGTLFDVWVNKDPEANGPGAVSIEKCSATEGNTSCTETS